MYLLETNIWLELLLNQEKADEVKGFLNHIKDSDIYISSFSFYSICIFLSRMNKFDTLISFVNDLSENNIEIINTNLLDIQSILEIEKSYNLDFDDALQYYLASSNKITLIGYDKDFEKTPLGRITPDVIMKNDKSYSIQLLCLWFG